MDLKKHAIDVAIPAAPKDFDKLAISMQGLHFISPPPRRIFLIVKDDSVLDFVPDSLRPLTTVVPESRFPFSKEDIGQQLMQIGSQNKNFAWYFQQLLKLYIFRVLGDECLDNVAIVDADFCFVAPVQLLSGEGKPVLAHGYPFKWFVNTDKYPEAFSHVHVTFARRFLPEWRPTSSFSGMQHHMVFSRQHLQATLDLVEKRDQKPFWRAIFGYLSVEKLLSFSEYIIMHHWMKICFPDHFAVRHLDHTDLIYDCFPNKGLQKGILLLWQKELAKPGNLAVGCHAMSNLCKRVSNNDYWTPEFKVLMEGMVFGQKLKLRNGKFFGKVIKIEKAIRPVFEKECKNFSPEGLIAFAIDVFDVRIEQTQEALSLEQVVSEIAKQLLERIKNQSEVLF